MNEPDLFSEDEIREGEQLRDKGMQQAVDHADRVSESWQEKAYSYFSQYAASNQFFQTGDVRRFALLKGFEDAPDPRAWGAVARRAVVNGIIKPYTFQPAKCKTQHRCPTRVWETQ